MERKLLQVQIALFFKKNLEEPIEKVSLLFLEKLGQPKEKIFPPTFPSLPPEIPRLILNYDLYRINFSLNRIDIFSSSFDERTKDILKRIGFLIIDDLKLEVGRVGFVKTFFKEKSPEDIKRLLNPKIISKIESVREIGMRINTRVNILGYECNNIESIKNGFVNLPREEKEKTFEKREGIIIQRDINTLQDKLQEYAFSSKKIIEILDIFNDKSEHFILINYEREF